MTIIVWSDPAVQAAAITTVGTMFATIVAAICASLIGKSIADRERLKEKLNIAIGDIAYLLAVEDEHCKIHKENTTQSSKMKIRQIAIDRGLAWSGKFTPGRAKLIIK